MIHLILCVPSSTRRCSNNSMHIFLFSDVDYIGLSCRVWPDCCALSTRFGDRHYRDLALAAIRRARSSDAAFAFFGASRVSHCCT